jgi:hypothetical protein
MAVTSILSVDPGLQAWAHLNKAGLNIAEAEMNYLLKIDGATAEAKRIVAS